MSVKEIMTYNPETIDAEICLTEAAEKLGKLDVGALPVWEGQKLAGIITDRDITIRAIAKGKSPSSTLVGEIMTREVFSCHEEDDIHDVAELMEKKSVHRLLVLDQDDRPVGFVSLADFAVKSRDERLAWEILERISEPACPHR